MNSWLTKDERDAAAQPHARCRAYLGVILCYRNVQKFVLQAAMSVFPAVILTRVNNIVEKSHAH